MIHISHFVSPIGDILLEAEDNALCGLWFIGQRNFPKRYENIIYSDTEPQIIKDSKAWLKAYFAGEQPQISVLSLNPTGTKFQKQVWDILRRIPYGKTISYGEIAAMLEKMLGRKMSAQAVGGAVGHNPISIIIPCHRVIGAKGSLTGYAAGLERKIALLELEKASAL